MADASSPEPARLSSRLSVGLIVLLAVGAYAGTLFSTELVSDDGPIIEQNALLRSWSSVPKLLTTGYWDSVHGPDAPVQEYRPLLMLGYFLTYQAFGTWPAPYHLTNILLHAGVCLLLWLLLRKELPKETALGTAALFAVLPVHGEAVGLVTGRSEPMAVGLMLLAWLDLRGDKPRVVRGAALFLAACLTKEQAVLFPALLLLHDFARGVLNRARAGLYGALALCAALYLGARSIILTESFRVGAGYFSGKSFLVTLLTMARFSLDHYLLPTATGLGLRTDFSRPFYPDAAASDPLAWLSLAGWTGLLAASAWRLFKRRSEPAFWTLAGVIYFLPVSNLLIPLDKIGAPRFMYFPSVAFCVVLAAALARLPRRAGLAAISAAVLWFAGCAVVHNRTWRDRRAYYEAALRANPHAEVLAPLAVVYLKEGEFDKAVAALKAALKRNPSDPLALYNLGSLRAQRGNWSAAEDLFRRAAESAPNDPDNRVFLALACEKAGRYAEAAEHYGKALSIKPWDPRAHHNLARILWAAGRKDEASKHFAEFLRLAPNDPSAPRIRKLLGS